MEKNIINIASFNIASLAFNKENGIRIMNKFMKDKNIDIAGLQEVDYFTGRNNIDMLSEFEKEGYFKDHFFSKAVSLSGGDYGIGILSKSEITSPSAFTYKRCDAQNEDRILQRVNVKINGIEIAFYNTHLSYENQQIRKSQISEILNAFEKDTCPYKIITGDFNALDTNDEFSVFSDYGMANGAGGKWFDSFNGKLSPDEHRRAIDNIIFTKNIKLIQSGMIEDKVSDHNMLYAELEICNNN